MYSLEGLRKLVQVERAVSVGVELFEGRRGSPLPQRLEPRLSVSGAAERQRGGAGDQTSMVCGC